MLLNILLIIIGFGLLAWGADRLIAGASTIAKRYHVSPLIIGITLVALGTSLPEIVTSTYAAIYGAPEIALGNAIGSNITNITLVLGLTVLLIPIRVHISLLRREFPLLFIVMLSASLLMFDGYLNHWDGLLLIFVMLIVLWRIFITAKRSKNISEFLSQATEIPTMRLKLAWFYFILGIILLPLGTHLAIENSVTIAKQFGISDLVIGLTLVALGTSLPELATSIAGARKKQYDLIAGNILGSNIFNLLIVLALPAIIQNIPVSSTALLRDLPVMFLVTMVLFGLLYFWRKKGGLGRIEGLILLVMYVVYMVIVIVQA